MIKSLFHGLFIFKTFVLSLSLIFLIGCSSKTEQKSEEKVSQLAANPNGLSIVFVNSDSIWSNYTLVKEKEKELATYEENIKRQYAGKLQALDQRFNRYVESAKAGKLSLDEQKRTEASLAKEEEELRKMDEMLSKQLMSKQQTINTLLTDSIVNFIKRYNQKYKFTYILNHSATNISVLYGADSLDITTDVIKAINEDYASKKK